MSTIAEVTVEVSSCVDGIYLRYYHHMGGWHHVLVNTRREANQKDEVKDTICRNYFSNISRVDEAVSKDITITYECGIVNISASDKDALVGLLMAENVYMYKNYSWINVKIQRGSFTVKKNGASRYNIEFTIELDNYLEGLE